MKKILFTLCFLISVLSTNILTAQFVLDAGSSVYIDNETMYVQAPTPDLVIKSGAVLKLVNNAVLDVDGSITLEGGATIEMDPGTNIRLGGNFTVSGSVTFITAPTCKIEFKGGSIVQNFSCADANFKIGYLLVNTKEVNLASDMYIMAGGKVEFANNLDPEGSYIVTNTNKLVLEAQGNDYVSFIGLDTSIGTPAPLKKYYVNGTIDYQVTPGGTTSTYLFPVGGNQSLQLMKIEFSPGAITANNIKLVRTVYQAGAPGTVAQNLCNNAVINAFSGVWDYQVFTGIDGSGPIDKLNASACDDVNSYTLTLNPRSYTVSKPNFFVAIQHTGESEFTVHQIPSAGNCATENCENYTTAGEVIAHKITRFSKAAAVEGDNPFPVELSNFGLKSLKNSIRLNWTTENVQNVTYFDLERSLDAKKFNSIREKIPVQGDGLTTQNYFHTDKDVVPNKTYYYRLKSVGPGGNTYSKIIEGRLNDLAGVGQSLDVSVYPNPSNGTLGIDVNLSVQQEVKVSLFDLAGRQLIDKTVNMNEGLNKLELGNDFSTLSVGTYNLVIRSNDSVTSTKVVKNK